ncbi:inositol monophosphatase family protein [Methylobacterium nodulans]|uniref:Inositol-1-monophosphatase n=1 Tax=Methylobacterium nodulans (strain LMG 21967 / CNCM I-2342 / ORS 2060) TaxID=460265 RepID=B8IFY0_METNO|nr:inositol monophosphatase family protein [Methylobacterium nodulans]ACL59690.1 inositol monophosphatase [Methylobacterium nodulans ORS 2060]
MQSQLSHDPDRFTLAVEVAQRAGERALAFFERRDALVIERKSSVQDLVSQADREVESLIRAAIATTFPDDAVLGEEEGLRTGRSNYTWVVDPIDGTSPFLNGQPNWCVSIAVRGPRGIETGVIAAPVLRETYLAARGAGATLNGRRLQIDPATSLTSANIGYGATSRTAAVDAAAFVERLYRESGILFRNGSGALMLAYVAAGRLAGYYDPGLSAWDCYAGLLLVEEAGGVAEFDGSDDMLTRGALRAGTRAVVEDLRRLSAGLGDAPR